MHGLVMHNGSIVDASARVLAPGQVGFVNGWGVFSTIRVREGVLFAFERHFGRMQRDAELMRVPFFEHATELHGWLHELVEANRAYEAVLRVSVVRNRGGLFEAPGLRRDFDCVAFTSEINDWGSGVRLYVVPDGRHAGSRFAGAKVTSWAQNLVLYEQAHQRGFDEVLLLNERGELSECTSANIFLARGATVLTPPLSSGCLPGVTRELLLHNIRTSGITVLEQVLWPADLESADEVFITSTTRDLLPVTEVEGYAVRRGDRALEALTASFRAYMDEYVKAARTAGVR